APRQAVEAHAHLGAAGRLQLAARRAMRHRIGVDLGDSDEVAFQGRAYGNSAHNLCKWFHLPAITAKADTKEKGGRWAALRKLYGPVAWMEDRLAAVAHQLQQEREEIDEVEIELQRAHRRLTAQDVRG